MKGSFRRHSFQPLRRKLVEPAVTAPVAEIPPVLAGAFDFSAALNSGLILLLEDI